MSNRVHILGLTLVEVLVVVAVIVILTTIIVKLSLRIETQAKEKGLQATFAVLDTALQEYHDYTGAFPVQEEIDLVNVVAHIENLLAELFSIPTSAQVLNQKGDVFIKNNTGLADKPEAYDPWHSVLDYQYISGNAFPVLISAGPDKVFGTNDDITNRQ